MAYRIQGLDPALFANLHSLSDDALRARGIEPYLVQAPHAAPCRIGLEDAPVGERILLLNYDHQPAQTPYQQQGPIFVRAYAARFDEVDIIPPAMARRTLSLRGFDRAHMMIEADLVEGKDAETLIARFFENADVAYIQAHYARRGCYAARIDRA